MPNRAIPEKCWAPDIELPDGGFTDGHKSTRSQTSNCVEIYPRGIGLYAGKAAIADSKDRSGGSRLIVETAALDGLIGYANDCLARKVSSTTYLNVVYIARIAWLYMYTPILSLRIMTPSGATIKTEPNNTRGMVMTSKPCDIVLEGGGVKGTGLVGALEILEKAGYVPQRIAGTSAGAIIGSLLAAGMKVGDMVQVMKNLDYRKFRDEGVIDKLSLPGKSLSLIFEKGIYEGKYLHEWLVMHLEALGVRTFADLRITEPWAEALPPEQRYRLVVIVSDVSHGRMVRLPWDYQALYGLNPDEQLVADAVRASMSIPFFYEPFKLQGNFLVDGGLLSNFPINLFDQGGDWPTFGIKLSAKPDANTVMNPVTNPLDYTMAIISTAINGHDQMHVDDPCTQQRTIFVDTFDIKATNFDITKADQERLYQSGQKYAREFLNTWDFEEYKKVCIPVQAKTGIPLQKSGAVPSPLV